MSLTQTLTVPATTMSTHTKGHRHRRSAAISLDWRHISLPSAPSLPTAPSSAPLVPAGSPTLTFASTVSDCSLGDADDLHVTSTRVSTRSASPRKRVTFSDAISEIPSGEAGDTWMHPEDYSWHASVAGAADTVVVDALEPSIDLAPATLPLSVPGSPNSLHRKKRSSFLQSTRNVLSRRPSKKRPVRPVSPAEAIFGIIIPPPAVALIDLDVVLAAPVKKTTSITHEHKKSGSLSSFSTLPASPNKPKQWHRRADSTPHDMHFTFSPRTASPESRKRKMSSIVESPLVGTSAPDIFATSDKARPRSAGLQTPIPDDLIFGMPGDMVSTRTSTESAVSMDIVPIAGSDIPKQKKGWKGMLRRLLH